MALSVTPVGVLFGLATVTAAAIGAYAATRLEVPGSRGLVLLMVGDTIWAATDALNAATTEFAASRVLLAARYGGIVLVPVALLVFTVAYTGREEWLTRQNLAAVSLPSVLTVAAVATNPVHGRFYARVASDPAAAKGLDWAYGAAAIPWIVWAYLLVFASVYLLVRYARVADRAYRWQAVALVVAVSVPTVTDLLFFTVPALTVNVTPVGIIASGLAIGAAIYRHDLLDLVPATRELGRNELIERMDLGMVLVDADGDVADVNPAAARVLGVDPGAILGQAATTATPALAPVLADRDEVDLTIAVDGRERRFDVRAEPVAAAGGGATLVTLRDVTARHERRRELERYETVVETLADPVLVTDADGTVVFANRVTADATDYDAATIEGMALTDFVAPGDADRLDRVVGSLASEDRSRATVDVDVQASDGRRFPAEARFSPLPADEGFRGVAGVVRDVSRRERRERQLEVLNRVLRHNLRSRMQVVLGNATSAAERVDDPEVVALMDAISDAARDLTELGDEARMLQARVEDASQTVRELRPLVDARVADYRERYPEATFEVAVPDDATVLSGPGLADVVDNLLENAVEHHDRPDPAVTVDAVPDDDHPDEWLRLRVADDGPGIPALERRIVTGEEEITDLRHGSGLGLWVVAWIVRVNGGDVDIAANEPRGTVVSCRFRRA